MKIAALVLPPLFALMGTISALAADHTNLEEGIPTSLEDAYPIAYRNREAQGAFEFRRTSDDKNIYLLRPRFEFGFAPNWQATLRVPVVMGETHEGSGDIGFSALYNPFQETIYVPAVAFSAEGIAPSGKDSAGVDATYKLIATKTLGRSRVLQRAHTNLVYQHNAAARDDERQDFMRALAGYEVRMGADTVGVIDYAWEQVQQRDERNNLLELGLRQQLTPLALVAVGGAIGLDGNSDAFRLTAGFQRSF